VQPLRVIFMGTAEIACPSLAALCASPGVSVVAVVTQPDRPKGRDLKVQPCAVKQLAVGKGLPVLQPERARQPEFVAELTSLRPDLIAVMAYGQILPPAILDLPPLGCVNVHTSLLPKYRGAAPIQWAIANGDTETGVTVMQMDAGMDTGGILTQRTTPIRPEDNAQTLHDRLAQLGAELLVETIPGLVSKQIQPRPQPTEGASHARKITKEDGRIDWRQPARTIWNRLRAFTPWPGAFTFWFGVPPSGGSALRNASPPEGGTPNRPLLLKIWEAEVTSGQGTAGQVMAADKSGVVVGCGRDALRLLTVQREGGRRMGAAEFLAGHPLQLGQEFVSGEIFPHAAERSF
jgi:methionyl-tRNA formyltransferase